MKSGKTTMENLEKKTAAFAELLEIIATLRVECPWDKKQTMESMRSLSIEEVYELGDAILAGDMEEVKKELGDLLMHVVFYAQIGEEQGRFDISGVLEGICEKLKYRHPHIYGDVKVKGEEDVLRNWEQLKLKENGRRHRVLEGVPASLPALVKAYRIQDKARGAGFDWEKREDVWAKVKEEIAEVDAEMLAGDKERLEGEFGDLFFSLINACRLYGVDPEAALERTNKKFIRRFGSMEERAAAEGHTLHELSSARMEELWEQAKTEEK